MRLRRIEAVRFGRLEGASLGDLGDGLTLVLGPNEAGKTSFTTLVRHVLYGFPDRRLKEPRFESAAGTRQGRLVFAEGAGEWVAERTAGAHGGAATVRALAGPDRPGLLGEITRGVSREAFRIVFGFGLRELEEIEAARGSEDDILSRLSAAQVGLAVSPHEVRAGLAADAGRLWKSRAPTSQVNALTARIKEVKSGIRALEDEALTFARDQERLLVLAEEMGAAAARRSDTSTRARELALASGKLEQIDARLDELSLKAADTADRLAELRRRRDACTVDERLTAVSSELTALLDEMSAFKERVRRVAEIETQARSVSCAADDTLAAAGLSPDQSTLADIGPATQAGLERWRADLASLESAAAQSHRAAEDICAEAERKSAGGEARAAGLLVPIVAVIVAALGLASVVHGALAPRSPFEMVAGGVIVAAAAVLFVATRRARSGSASSVLAGTGPAGSAQRAQAVAEREAEVLESRRAEWRAWLEARGLAHAGEDPAAVAMLVSAIKEWRDSAVDARRLDEAAAAERDWCEAFRARFAAVVGDVLPEAAGASLDELPVRAARVRQMHDEAAETQRERATLDAEIARLETETAEIARAREAAQEQAEVLRVRVGLPDADSLAVHAASDEAVRAAEEAETDYADAAREHTSLQTRLGDEERTTAMAELRLELTGLEERREAALAGYAVLAVAERLIGSAQKHYERERQPVVIKRAGEILSSITAGRYERLVLSEDGRLSVLDASSELKPSSELSTGTAEQLYLALRIALIETLDGVGVGLPVMMDDVLVNFDPERRRGAAEAVCELAEHRQVVLFTCHPETAELMGELAPDHTALTLARC